MLVINPVTGGNARNVKMWLFNFFRVGLVIAKKINHRGHGGHRELLFLCALCGFPKHIPEDNKKSHEDANAKSC